MPFKKRSVQSFRNGHEIVGGLRHESLSFTKDFTEWLWNCRWSCRQSLLVGISENLNGSLLRVTLHIHTCEYTCEISSENPKLLSLQPERPRVLFFFLLSSGSRRIRGQ